MSIHDFLLSARHVSRKRRSFTPDLMGLEGRQLLSLYFRGGQIFSATAWDSPPATVSLGYVSSNSSLDVKDPLSATVDWGDGTNPDTVSNAGIVWSRLFANAIYVPGHTFQQSGSLVVHITVQDQHGGSVSWNDTASVTDAQVDFTQEEAVPVGVATNVVGAKFRLDTYLISRDPTAVLDSVTYTFTEPDGSAGGVIAVDKVDVNGDPVPYDQTGFHEEEVRSDFGEKDGITHAHIEDYWGSTPGVHHVSTYITWHNSKMIPFGFQLQTSDFNITAPTASVQTNFGNTTYQFLFNPQFVDTPGWFLTSFKPGQQGITIDATLNGVTDAGGTYGIVQMVKPTSYYWDLTGQKYQMYVSVDPQGKTPSDWPLLDNDPNSPDNPYYDIVASGQYKAVWSSGDSLHLVDAPRVQISTLDTKIQESDSFQDFVMFTPTGGIPVPIAMNLNWSQDPQYSFTWSWGGTLTWDVGGVSPNPSGLQDPSLSWMSYAVPTTPTWGNTAWYYQQNMPNGIPVV